MATLAAVGGSLSILLQLLVGLRLLWQGVRTRALPELALGFGLFAMGGIATPAVALARAPLGLGAEASAALLFVYCAVMALGAGGLTLFTQRVFRPSARWAKLLAAALPAGMLAALFGVGLGRGFAEELASPGMASLASNLCLFVALAWSGWESLGHAAQLKRRMALGLAEPVVVNRVRLWGVAMGFSTLMCGAGLAFQLASVPILNHEAGATALALSGLVSASALYLAFFPPPLYLRWVAKRFAR
jgi:hypothetical protein